MHIRDKFSSSDSLDQWRQTMQDVLSEKFHAQIQSLSDSKMAKIKDMMKIRVHFYHDLNNHTYFFEQPQYDTERAAKFLKKLS